MILKHQVRLYACLAKDEPLAIAVYDVPEKKFAIKRSDAFPNGGTIFPIAVGVRLKEKIRVNRATGVVKWMPRRDIGGEPYPFHGGFAADDPNSLQWVRWEADDMMRQSLHFMLSQCVERGLCEFGVADLKQDWSVPGFKVDFEAIKSKPIKLTRLLWLTAWRLPFWEEGKLSNLERFREIQEIAAAYGIKGFTSKGHFENRIADIKKA